MKPLRLLFAFLLLTAPQLVAAQTTFQPGSQLKATDLNNAFTAIRGALEAIEAAGYPPLSGTTAQRPTAPALGQPYFNTDTKLVEHWNGTAWIADTVSNPAPSTQVIAPSAPLNVQATGTSLGQSVAVRVSFDASTTGTSPTYAVQTASCGSTAFSTFATTATPAITIVGTGGAGVAPGACVSVRVLALNDAAPNGVASPIVQATIPTVIPGPPLLSAGTVTDTTATLVWTISEGGNVSFIPQQKNGTTWTNLYVPMGATGPVGSTMSFQATGLTAASPYTFRILASNSAGQTPSSEVTVPTAAAATVVPGVPTAVAFTNVTANGATVGWTPSATGSTPISFKVEYRVQGASSWTTAVTGWTVDSFTFSNLTANTPYEVRVSAHNSAGDSATTAPVDFTTATGVAPPASASCTGTQTTATNPTLTGPASCASGLGAVATVSGLSIDDDMTQCCGQLNITSTYGTVSMTRNGSPISGSGTTSWNDQGTLAQINADLATAAYAAPAASGSTTDTMTYEWWAPDGHHNALNIPVNLQLQGDIPAGPTRTPWDQPFSATSVWNIGIGSGATWGTGSDLDVVKLRSLNAYINGGNYSIPEYVGTSSDPLVTVTSTDTEVPIAVQHIHIPANATPALPVGSEGDHHMTFFDETQPGKLWSYHGCAFNNGTDVTGGLTCGLGGVWDTTGNGVDQTIQDGGKYDFTVGLITPYDLAQGKIAHALRFSISDDAEHMPGATWLDNTIYPNWAVDFNAASEYTGGPNSVTATSTIGIPADVDLSSLGLSSGGMMIAKALQDYGAIWRDSGGANQFAFYVEPSVADDPLVAEMGDDLAKIKPYISIMRNQSATTINGGGTYSQPAPPPFAAPGLPTGGGGVPGAGGGGDSTGHAAARVQDVWGGFGINTHLDNCCSGNGGHSYADTQGVISAINYIGNVKLLRDYWEADSLNTLAAQVSQQTGAKWITAISEGAATAGFPTDLGRMRSFQASCHCVWAYDGPNEWDSSYSATTAPGTTGLQRLQAAAADQPQVYSAAKADGVLALQFTTGVIYPDDQSGYRCCGAVNNADYGNGHTYPESAPELYGEFNGSLDWVDEEANRLTPGKPVVHTEFGWIVGGSGFGLETLANQAVYTDEFIFDAYRHGDAGEIYYGLYDDISGKWGLFDENNAPRPVAVSLHNLSAILNDTATNARTFSTGLLNINFPGMPTGSTSLSGGQFLVMEKSDGKTFDVEVGNEQDLGRQGVTINVPSVAQTVNLGFTATSVKIYDPINGGAAYPSSKANWPLAKNMDGSDETWSNVSTFTMALPSHPVIIEIVHP